MKLGGDTVTTGGSIILWMRYEKFHYQIQVNCEACFNDFDEL